MFEHIGLVRPAPGGDMAQINVKLGDIDGDGRIDYCLIAGNGDIQCWRNGGQREAPTSPYGSYWQDLGTVFTGKGMGDITGVRLVDINGDFRSDWLWLDETGKVTTYINNRGTGKGSLAPDWVSVGVTHAGMQVKGAKDRVKFGRVYTADRKGADYVYIKSQQLGPSTGGAPLYDHYLYVWKNTGSGGTRLKGDGVFYCDMRGTGADDYVWVSVTGTAYLYGNIHTPPRWDPEGPVIFEAGVDRKRIRLADFDGDGKSIGQLELPRYGSTTGILVQTPCPRISVELSLEMRDVQRVGAVGLYDLGVRFHDIDGDRRADYLCMEPNGRTTGALNLGESNFKDMGQVKRAEGYDRANHKWANVNGKYYPYLTMKMSNCCLGDGLVDFLWVDKFNGDTTVWRNEGPIPEGELVSGSTFRWTKLDGPQYKGADRGANMHFPNLGGLGRADFHQVVPHTNKAYTWFNECPGSGTGPAQDDQDPLIDPYGWGTISIGGNDVGFPDIAWNCLYWANADICAQAMGNAAVKLRSEEFRLALALIYDCIMLDALSERQPTNQRGFLLLVTGYMQFFYDQDNACDGEYFWRGMYLTQDLRQRMNALVVELNNVIQSAIREAQDSWGGAYNIIYYDADARFQGNRFCQPGRDYRDSWFLVPFGADALADDTDVAVDLSQYPPSQLIDLMMYWQSCSVTGVDLMVDFACEYSKSLQNGGKDIGIGPLLGFS
ncbi:hypothetical protein BDV06DRAFT_229313 [Aspergillus oleicola]